MSTCSGTSPRGCSRPRAATHNKSFCCSSSSAMPTVYGYPRIDAPKRPELPVFLRRVTFSSRLSPLASRVSEKTSIGQPRPPVKEVLCSLPTAQYAHRYTGQSPVSEKPVCRKLGCRELRVSEVRWIEAKRRTEPRQTPTFLMLSGRYECPGGGPRISHPYRASRAAKSKSSISASSGAASAGGVSG